MPARTESYFVPAPDADRILEMAAAPALPVVGRAIAELIPQYVPVNQGVARAHTKSRAGSAFLEGGHPQARVFVNSARWHFFEYGVRGQAPTRPVQRSVESLGLRYTPR
jgi:hypothetical protein